MAIINPPVPVPGPRGTEETNASSAINALLNDYNGNITDANIAAAGLSKLAPGVAEPAFSTWKTILERSGQPAHAGAGIYLLNTVNILGAGLSVVQGIDITNAGAAGNFWFDLDPADFTAGARTTKFRLRGSIMCNGTPIGGPVRFALAPITATTAGGVNSLVLTLGASTATVTLTPSSSGVTRGTTTEFTLSSVGTFVLALLMDTALPANSAIQPIVQLQMRQV